MTLSEILQAAYAKLNYVSAPPAAVTTRFTQSLNAWHRRILAQPGMGLVRDAVYTLTTVDGTAEYALPPTVGRLIGMTQISQGIPLVERSLDWFRRHDPQQTSIGAPSSVYIPLGERHVQAQPADASELFVDSTSASDTGTAFCDVTRIGGYPRSLSAVMTGATAVSLGAAAVDAIWINKFYLSVPAVGTVTLHEDVEGGTELARIPIGQTYARYPWIRLWPTPAGEDYAIDYTRTLVDLVNGSDEPLWPADFHWLLVTAIEYEEFIKTDDSRARTRLQEIDAGLRDLKSWLFNRPGTVYVPGQREPGRSSLGPWYPAGT
jgi:hypothetical protein